MSRLPKEIQSKIQNVQAGHSSRLDLRYGHLSEIPDQVFPLSGLRELILRDNQIRIVPDRIRELTKLEKLDLCAADLGDRVVEQAVEKIAVGVLHRERETLHGVTPEGIFFRGNR